MATFRDSQTAKNLLTSYAFESQAFTRYTFYADKARDEQYIQISDIFKETANQELEHALRFFKFFNGGELEITATFLTGVVKSTYDNLLAASDLEHHVHTTLYPGFAAVARNEGFERAAETWDAISKAEKQHEQNFSALAQTIKTGIIFNRSEVKTWRCKSCGYIHEGQAPPEKCPACVKPPGYFELMYTNW
ncbi:MAG: rubrerythrin family protein [Proteobacteria bacterium]|nr:rubrerythrin family protein [Pseudomonadota bacterium]